MHYQNGQGECRSPEPGGGHPTAGQCIGQVKEEGNAEEDQGPERVEPWYTQPISSQGMVRFILQLGCRDAKTPARKHSDFTHTHAHTQLFQVNTAHILLDQVTHTP